MAALGLGPSLGLRARARDLGFDFTGTALPPGAVLTRASAATRSDAARRIVSEAADVARFDHDPVSGARLGLLIEGEATNIVLRSDALGHAAWARTTIDVVDGAPSPDGGAAATVLTDPASGSYAYVAQTIAAAGQQVASAYVRKDAVPIGTRYSLLRVSPGNDFRFLASTGEHLVLGGTGGVIDAGDYWRVWTTPSGTPQGLQIYPAPGAGTLASAYATTPTGSLTMWGCQLEAGTVPTSYVPTEGAAATRAADRLALDWGSRGVADGAVSVRYTFDDASTQVVAATVVGGVAIVPTGLARRHLRRVERV